MAPVGLISEKTIEKIEVRVTCKNQTWSLNMIFGRANLHTLFDTAQL